MQRGRADRAQRRNAAAAARSESAFDGSRLRHALLVVVSLKAALLVLAIDPDAANSFEIPKLVVSRITAFASAGLLAAILMRFGLGVVPRTPMHFGVAVIAAAYVLSLAFAEDRYVGLFGEPGSYLGATFALEMVITYLALATCLRSGRDWATLGLLLAASAVIAVLYGMAQRLGWDPIRWTEDSSARPISTLGNTNLFGHFLSVVAGSAIAVALLPPPGRHARLVRSAATALTAAATTMIALGAARGALIGLTVAFGAAGILFVRSLTTASQRRRALAGLAALGLTIALMSAATPLGARVVSTFAGRGMADRLLIYDSAVRAIGERPLFGHGPDSFAIVYPRYRQPGSAQVLSTISEVSAHSWILTTAATLGALGLIALLGALCLSVTLLWRAFSRAPWLAAPVVAGTAAYWANGAVSIGALAVDWMPWFAFGCAAALSARPTASVVRRVPAIALGVPIAIGLGLGLLSFDLLLTERDRTAAQAHYGLGDAGGALAAARSAVGRDPERAENWNWLGLAYTLSESWPQAGDAFERATSRASHRVTYWANLARARLLEAGQNPAALEAAIRASERAVEVDPNDPEGHAVSAVVWSEAGRHDRAIDESLLAYRVAPYGGSYASIVVEAASRSPDGAAGLTALDEAIVIRDDLALHVAKARLLLRSTSVEQARDEARRVLATDPRNADAIELLRDSVPLGTTDRRVMIQRQEEYLAHAFPAGLSEPQRRALAEMYREIGDMSRAREIMGPPRIHSATRQCDPLSCARYDRVQVSFETSLGMATSGPGSIADLATYAIDEQPLPPDVSIEIVAGPVGPTAVLTWPTAATPPDAGALLTVRGAADIWGSLIAPDPSTVRLP